MPIYTRRGDTGTTRIYGSRDSFRKTDSRIVALGAVDELNAQLGMLLVHCTPRGGNASGRADRAYKITQKQLLILQQELFEIGAEIATAQTAKPPFEMGKNKTRRLERWIDFYWKKLPPLSNFIFPGGSLAGAQLHIVRTVCRRAERVVVELAAAEKVNPNILSYLNRLSDFLLALARWVNKLEGIGDFRWVGASKKR